MPQIITRNWMPILCALITLLFFCLAALYSLYVQSQSQCTRIVVFTIFNAICK